MTRLQWKTPVLVIADDFTGANDAGSGLARAGARVNVLFNARRDQDADVHVINTDSRAVSAGLAARLATAAIHSHADIAASGWVFKKMDSTLRGNPGAEIEAALLASGAPAALIAPAVPTLGRVTREGCCFIHEQLLTTTEYASDPKTPVTQASVLLRLKEQSSLPVGLIPLSAVREADLVERIHAAIDQGQLLIVVDAETDDDLQRIMRAASQLAQRPLLAGAAGLSDALGNLLAQTARAGLCSTDNGDASYAEIETETETETETEAEAETETVAATAHGRASQFRPVLAVVGSMSEITQRQLTQLQQHKPLCLIDVDITQLFTGWQDSDKWLQTARQALLQGRHCVIRTCQQADQRRAITALCERYDLSRQQLGESICLFLAELTGDILSEATPAGLYLSGGDVAIAVAHKLGAQGFHIVGQVAGCVPYGQLLACKNDLLVLTKAGGFGDDNTLVEVFRFIEEKASE
ncbi:four-carbon acid sugar kinase family protein [Pantoea sp. CCBC3-3-1]|uniref:four-carbon acid sugar kinase family protein n=1 Tax=Pantoea sp. CCBC3-3-1 TaxID=2490851 RepID=UPI0011BF5383|nr:four-carbon acid sugar kinase family protein [Pantoea sp. CCBC3-3-1]